MMARSASTLLGARGVTSSGRHRSASPPATRMIPRLDFHDAGPDGWSEAWWNGSLIGSVCKLGKKWKARLPGGGRPFPVAFDSRKAAGERLRRTAESRSAGQEG